MSYKFDLFDKTEKINVFWPDVIPNDYHCNCKFCKKFKGTLIRKEGTLYNKKERNKYYVDQGLHVAKTPCHLARFCVQRFSKEGDWVFDPTIGAGSTAVEALNHGRNVIGIELEFADLVIKNIEANHPKCKYKIISGDARRTDFYLRKLKRTFSLIINNPPYSADECERFKIEDVRSGRAPENKRVYVYNPHLENIAFIKHEGTYYSTMYDIYRDSIEFLNPGGYFCIGVKDMVKQQKPLLLHKNFGEILENFLHYRGMYLLPHYPPTLFMSTYPKKFPRVKVPKYQTILVFQKGVTK